MIATGKPAAQFAQDKQALTDVDAMRELCKQVMAKFTKWVEDYRKNPNVLNSLLGQVMRESKGRADAQMVRKILLEMLEKNSGR
jgi:aspartyl-tRNA(Asn)/glutamyl-tRNA(Gln) amidotransferase subunit B